MTRKERAEKFCEILKELYPEAICSLNYSNPLELLIATQLSAQCTDARVNIVTETLFKKYPDAEIHTLIGKIKLTKSEKVIDNVLGFFTDAPFGTPDLINSFKNLDKEFYLVTEGDQQYFVTVTDEFIESRRARGEHL